VLRIDASQLDTPERTDEGFVRAEGIIAPPGALEYRTKSGETVTEYVPEETLDDEEFLESLEGKPVTLEHPPPDEPVDPDNYREHAVGHIQNVQWVDGPQATGVKGEVLLKDKDAIEAFETGTDELSPRYEVDLVEHDGPEYDYVQAKRRAGNHVALTESGRAGTKARLRADSDAAQSTLWRADDADQSDDNDTTSQPQGETMPEEQVRLDSERTVQVDEQTAQLIRTWKQDMEDEQLELSSEVESAQSSIEEFKQTISELEDQRDELQTQIERKKKQLQKLADKMGLSEIMGGGASDASEAGDGQPTDDGEGGGMQMPSDSKLDSLIAESIDELCRERMDALAAAEAVGLEVDEETPTTDIKADVVEEYFGDRSPDRADSAHVDAHFNAAVDMIEERAEEREESIRSANQRSDSTTDPEPDAKQQYREQVFH